MTPQAQLDLAIRFAMEAHGSQKDKAGMPYILHPLRVMLALPYWEHRLRAVAVLHDVVEDTGETLEDLLNAGLDPFIVNAVDALTKRRGETYEFYLQRVRKNPSALTVKAADMADNMDPDRLRVLHAAEADRLRIKYLRALAILGGAQ
jgi:(p)ppGpp synthase/HD superfamily hydrolase